MKISKRKQQSKRKQRGGWIFYPSQEDKEKALRQLSESKINTQNNIEPNRSMPVKNTRLSDMINVQNQNSFSDRNAASAAASTNNKSSWF